MFLFHWEVDNETKIVWQMTTAIAIEDVRREVKILKALSGHRNLIKFYDAFEDAHNVYVVMEYVLLFNFELFSFGFLSSYTFGILVTSLQLKILPWHVYVFHSMPCMTPQIRPIFWTEPRSRLTFFTLIRDELVICSYRISFYVVSTCGTCTCRIVLIMLKY